MNNHQIQLKKFDNDILLFKDTFLESNKWPFRRMLCEPQKSLQYPVFQFGRYGKFNHNHKALAA
jgi:hypothetical protein